MWFFIAILLFAFLASGSAFGWLLAKYKNLQDSTDLQIEELETDRHILESRLQEQLVTIEHQTHLNARHESQIKILNGMVDRRNQRVDYYKREVDKCKDEHKNMSKMLTLALNDSNPFTRRKALRVP